MMDIEKIKNELKDHVVDAVKEDAKNATLVWINQATGRPTALPEAFRALKAPTPALPGADTPPALPEK